MSELTTGHEVNGVKIDSLKEWTIAGFGIILASIFGLYIQNYVVAKDLKHQQNQVLGTVTADAFKHVMPKPSNHEQTP